MTVLHRGDTALKCLKPRTKLTYDCSHHDSYHHQQQQQHPQGGQQPYLEGSSLEEPLGAVVLGIFSHLQCQNIAHRLTAIAS